MLATATCRLARAGVVIVGLGVSAAPVPAQQGRGPNRPVIVALPEVFPAPTRPGVDALALVYRFGGRQGRADIIVLNPAYATPHALRVAVLALRWFRATQELDSGRKLVIPVVPDPPGAQDRAASFRPLLERLRSDSRVGIIEGVGAARWLEFGGVHEIGR